jgi:hypothetical protein
MFAHGFFPAGFYAASYFPPAVSSTAPLPPVGSPSPSHRARPRGRADAASGRDAGAHARPRGRGGPAEPRDA